MERIQSAIAKARAARGAVPASPKTQAQAAPKPQKDLWSMLPEIQFDEARLENGRIVAHQPGPQAAVFDVMRTNLMHQLREHNWTRVAITSPSSSCGKTTLTLNLAMSLARQSDLKVVVLELDLRRPAMLRTLGVDRTCNVAAMLDGREAPETQLLRWRSNLALGLNSFPVTSPAELLSSDRAAETVDALEERLQPSVMLFDLPPMQVGDDTIAFLDQVDCALMVTEAETSTVAEIDRCGKDLAVHTQVLGVVLNKCRHMEPTESYGYGET
jgi:Mrp family chromosome partitioning ATPase